MLLKAESVTHSGKLKDEQLGCFALQDESSALTKASCKAALASCCARAAALVRLLHIHALGRRLRRVAAIALHSTSESVSINCDEWRPVPCRPCKDECRIILYTM